MQRDSVSERQEVPVSPRPIPVVAMVIERHAEETGRLATCLLDGGSQEFGHRGFGERVRSSPLCDEDRAILLKGHF